MRTFVVGCLTLLLSLPAVVGAESGAKSAVEEKREFNFGILQTDKDADIFLFALLQLQAGRQEKVVAFMDYQLDEIVCGLWGKMERMNPAQKKMAMEKLRAIKDYRRQHPPAAGQVKMSEVSKYLFERDPSVPEQAAAILAGL